MWEESLIFMLIYLGLFFLIPDKFRNKLLSPQYLAITIIVGILGACLGLYGIYTNLYSLENYQGIGDKCGTTMITCGADNSEDVTKTKCFVNQKQLLGATREKNIPFNMSGRYVRVRPLQPNAVMRLNQIIVFDYNVFNIAKAKRISTNSQPQNLETLNMLVDGVLNPRASGWVSDGRNGTYVEVDLGSVQEIGNIKIIALSNDALLVSVLQETIEEETTGKCILPLAVTFPDSWGATTTEKQIIGPLISMGYDGELALTILRGIKNSTETEFTEYGLTDSQAAAAYNILYSENLSKQRAGWDVFATWQKSSNKMAISSDSILPLVNMTIKSADGIVPWTRITSVSGSTVTLDKNTTEAGLNKPVKLNGILTDTTYYQQIEIIKPLITMALINARYNKSATLSTFMRQNRSVTVTYDRDLSGNPIGAPKRTRDNGETLALNLIIGVTKKTSNDPSAIESRDTIQTDLSGFSIPEPPDTTKWSTNYLYNLPLNKPVINLDTVDISNTNLSNAQNNSDKSNFLLSIDYLSPDQSVMDINEDTIERGEEVFWFGGSYTTETEADNACKNIEANGLATREQLHAAYINGAQWCSYGWLKDNSNKVAFPMQEVQSGCGTTGINETSYSSYTPAGATCYGYKPSDNDSSTKPLPFSSKSIPPSWYESTLLYNTPLSCNPNNNEEKRDCSGQLLCVKIDASCATACPLNYTRNTTTNICQLITNPVMPTVAVANIWEQTNGVDNIYENKLFPYFLNDKDGKMIKETIKLPGYFYINGTMKEIKVSGILARSTNYYGDGGDYATIDDPISLNTLIQEKIELMKTRCRAHPACTGVQQIYAIERYFDDINKTDSTKQWHKVAIDGKYNRNKGNYATYAFFLGANSTNSSTIYNKNPESQEIARGFFEIMSDETEPENVLDWPPEGYTYKYGWTYRLVGTQNNRTINKVSARRTIASSVVAKIIDAPQSTKPNSKSRAINSTRRQLCYESMEKYVYYINNPTSEYNPLSMSKVTIPGGTTAAKNEHYSQSHADQVRSYCNIVSSSYFGKTPPPVSMDGWNLMNWASGLNELIFPLL
jgi:hypothetical protein